MSINVIKAKEILKKKFCKEGDVSDIIGTSYPAETQAQIQDIHCYMEPTRDDVYEYREMER